MKIKNEPRPITSFLEDELDLVKIKKEILKESRNEARLETETKRKHYMVFLVRIIIALVAFGFALLLYIMLDDFIAHYFTNLPFLSFSSYPSTSCTI